MRSRVVLLHGFGSDRLSWLLNEKPLVEAGFDVIAIDLPGHGEAIDRVGDGSVAALADGLGIDGPAHWIGHSLGGAVALRIAQAQPERCASLTLIAPAGLGQGVSAEFLAAYPELADAESTATLLRRLVAQPRLIGRPLVARVLEQLSRPGAREALRAVAAGIAKAEQADVPDPGALPRLVVWGEADAINPLDEARVAHFGGELLRVAQAGHLPHIEAASVVNMALLRFLQEHQQRQDH